MIDIKRIRSNPDEISKLLLKKGYEIDFTEFLSKDSRRREVSAAVDNLRSVKKRLSREFAELKRTGGNVFETEKQIKETDAEIAAGEIEIGELDSYIESIMCELPNPPAEDVRAGGKENNEIIRVVRETASGGTVAGETIDEGTSKFDFNARDHMDLSKINGFIDYERGAKLSGNGFWIYRGAAARLEWALLNYFVSEHLADGYEMLFLPHILGEKCGFVAGQFPKFHEDVFYLDKSENSANESPDLSTKKDSGRPGWFVLPTAETALVNLHRDEILNEKELPLKYFALTPCYRKEAGSYRKEERGMIRGHQFNKVELFHYAHPEKSEESFEELVEKAERLVRELGLRYQVSKLAAADCSWAMGKTYDIEVWIPSMGIYKEVSSVSNAYEYQARRGNIRFKDAEKKIRPVHTLNASGLATSRVLPAIFEQFQNKDGSVNVPKVLQPYMGSEII
ncbi:MAG: serine--tRNA ligase [Oscillospiraceae bacterium]|nr:serine--tRNA ligase [Oscillospiraceae bacterium]